MDLPLGLEREFNFVVGSDLRSLAAWLPGGLLTMIRLARLSPDEKIRAVSARWNKLPRRFQRTVWIESLCAAADVPTHEFFGAIVGGALELDIDVTRMLAAQRGAYLALKALARQATRVRGGQRARQRFLEATGRLPRDGRRRRTRRRGPR